MPAARQRSSSPFIALAVTATTGVRAAAAALGFGDAHPARQLVAVHARHVDVGEHGGVVASAAPRLRAPRRRLWRCRRRRRATRAGAPALPGSPDDRRPPARADARRPRRKALVRRPRGVVRSVVLSGESAGAACSVSVTVKVEPVPGLLSAVMSPSISCASRRTIERPSPVPPKRRVVERSACANGWNSRARCSASKPMPVSVDRERDARAPCRRAAACRRAP